MPTSKNSRMKDLEIFARALENLLRTLIRFLVGKISLLKLSEMVRTIYIQEAERQLKIENRELEIKNIQSSVKGIARQGYCTS